jgi:hypothetical protein
MAKMHGWLVGALADRGYQQRDLAKAWKVDDAVVSRFISSGKPDLTPERQMMLSQMLGFTNDQLLARLYREMPVRRLIPPHPQSTPHREQTSPPVTRNSNPDAVEAEIRRAVEHLEELLPGATISIHITYDRRER